MRTEEIEKYLTNRMSQQERNAFENEMQSDPQLRDDVNIVKWTILHIRQIGREEDAERIRKIKGAMPSEIKRYIASIAVLFITAVAVAAISVPIYNKVVKPLIEKIANPEPKQESTSPTVSRDTVAKTVAPDTLTSQVEEIEEEEVVEEVKEEPKEEKVKKQDESKKEEVKKENAQKEEKVKEEPAKPVNAPPAIKVLSDKNGTKYTITKITKTNNTVTITINLRNDDDDNMISLSSSGLTLIDSDGNGAQPSVIKVNGISKSKFTLYQSKAEQLQLTYNLKGNPAYIQVLQLYEEGSHSKLLFKNLRFN